MRPSERHGMKKALKRVLIAATAVVAVPVLGLVATTAVNAVATNVERGKIEAYGQKVTVDGKQMNVLDTGEDPETIVLLPGSGTASPVLDFEPLTSDLAEDHRVIVVEPFGYGLSDGTDRPRTTENVVSEIHDALAALDVDEYVLMGHSVAGLYGIEFATRYPDEVTAFVGIDTSVPEQPGMDAELPVDAIAALKTLGIVRLVAAFSGDDYDAPTYPEQAQEQIGMITNVYSLNPTYLDEMAHLSTNFEDARGTTFPADLPLLMFVEEDNAANPDWLGLHERQAAEIDDATVIPMDGEHYLHHTHAQDIAAQFRAWEEERGRQ